MTLQVLSVASEAYPLVKTGGLADVVGALPAALAAHDVRVTTLIPGYPAAKRALKKTTVLHRYRDLLGVEASLIGGMAAGMDLILLDAPALYDRDGGLYADHNGVDWGDNWRRFAALGHAAADLADGVAGQIKPDVAHAHDWQGAMTAAYLKARFNTTPSVLTIHNLAFQGRFGPEIFPGLNLPPGAFSVNGVEYYGGVGFLKAGLLAADAITTVSPTYAREIRTPRFGMGLEGLMQGRADRVHGILNGIDTDIWNPAADPSLKASFDGKTLAKRKANRQAVEEQFGLNPGPGPIFCVISRLTWQKGMDVLAGVVDSLVAMGGRLALLGAGDPGLEAAFMAAAARHPGQVGVRIGYDEALAHRLEGGADAILIPSRFEPCGLTQMYGLRYGCVPIVARTGGLADTIIDANDAAIQAKAATGFQFDEVTHDAVVSAIWRAISAYGRPSEWRSLQQQGMKADVSWTRSGQSYAALYRQLLAG